MRGRSNFEPKPFLTAADERLDCDRTASLQNRRVNRGLAATPRSSSLPAACARGFTGPARKAIRAAGIGSASLIVVTGESNRIPKGALCK